ncbi:uncharacterized protein A4U43_C05F12140 [Asparagus officinalis]|uniref:Uncharacterized protein n=1 Tax=Asparagus officinalis TaxID=4686 RepID=A0A5P1ETP2_ASPOF|nr:uncharacterized protein A4U43_C05F12140 [Asparagus officinalis]
MNYFYDVMRDEVGSLRLTLDRHQLLDGTTFSRTGLTNLDDWYYSMLNLFPLRPEDTNPELTVKLLAVLAASGQISISLFKGIIKKSSTTSYPPPRSILQDYNHISSQAPGESSVSNADSEWMTIQREKFLLLALKATQINWKKYPEFQLVVQSQLGNSSEIRFPNPYDKGIISNIKDFINPWIIAFM